MPRVLFLLSFTGTDIQLQLSSSKHFANNVLRLQQILTVSHNPASTKKHLTDSFSGTSKFRKAVRCFHNHCSGERSTVWTRSSQSTRLVSKCSYAILVPCPFYLKTYIEWDFLSILIQVIVELYYKGFTRLTVSQC